MKYRNYGFLLIMKPCHKNANSRPLPATNARFAPSQSGHFFWLAFCTKIIVHLQEKKRMAENVNYIGTKRRLKTAGKIVYDVLDQTGLNDAIPSDLHDSIVVLGFKPGRNVEETVAPFLTMTVRVMLAETTAWRQPVPIDTDDEGTNIGGELA